MKSFEDKITLNTVGFVTPKLGSTARSWRLHTLPEWGGNELAGELTSPVKNTNLTVMIGTGILKAQKGIDTTQRSIMVYVPGADRFPRIALGMQKEQIESFVTLRPDALHLVIAGHNINYTEAAVTPVRSAQEIRALTTIDTAFFHRSPDIALQALATYLNSDANLATGIPTQTAG